MPQEIEKNFLQGKNIVKLKINRKNIMHELIEMNKY